MLDILLIKKAIAGVFPSGSELAENSFDVPLKERFWLIPGKDGPRWLIPQERKFGLLVFQQWSPYRLDSIVKWKILYAIYSAGRFGMLPGVRALGISGCSKNNWEHIGWRKETRPVPVIYFGTPCKTRKLVTLFFDSITSKLCIIVKMPLSKLASRTIKREFKILGDLQKRKVNIAPRPLHFDKKTGIACQSAINGRPTGRNFTILHRMFLESLRLSNKTISIYEKSLQLQKQLELTSLLNPSLKLILNKLLKDCKDSTQFLPVYVHGDFSPWNIKKLENGALVAFDWEMGDPNGLPVYDISFFFLIQSYLFNEKFNLNRIFNFLSENEKKYPVTKILKYTAASIGLRLVSEEQNPDYLEHFLHRINS